ncbi:MAG: ABC transporter permease [Burkholderiales bacterium]|nr:ABC transporter permease [Anaerolineae bacterium]
MQPSAQTLGETRSAWFRRSAFAKIPPVFIILLGMVIVLSIISPRSAEPSNLINLVRQGGPTGLVAIGQTAVMISGGLDLSVGSTVILADVMAAQMISGNPDRVIPVVLLVLAVGAGIGLVNGLLVTVLNVTPFIATLGSNFVVYGAALLYSGGTPRGDIPDNMRFWGNGFVAQIGTIQIPAAAVIWLIVTVITAIVFTRTNWGRRLVAVGANRRAAYLSGVNTRRVTLLAYIFSGFMAAAGGLLLVAFVGVGTLEVGTDFLLASIAACVIGGTPFEGGRGSVWGTVGGVLFLMVLYSILTALALPTSGRRIVEGIIILIAVALYARNRD